MKSFLPRAVVYAQVFVLCVALCFCAWGQSQRAASVDVWQVPTSTNLTPHFEQANGRKILYVDGKPFTSLAVEIPWWDLIAGRYAETQNAYDYLYVAAERMNLNTLKVPIKWAMVEPQKGVYDFSYVDHAKAQAEAHHLKLVLNWFGHYASGDGNIYRNLSGEVFAPLYIIEDERTYPRAVDADGVAHHNVASYEYDAIIEREIAAFRAFLQHIKKVDSERHTIIMVQVENEIAVFGWDRQNRKLWRDHSPNADKLYAAKGFTDDLKYSAWRLSSNWIRRLTDAGTEVYPLPFFHNFVGGTVADWMVGGAPGEDVATYMENCPNLAFIGVNSYFCAEWRPDYSCAKPATASPDELRAPLLRYRVSRNLPAITEVNSGPEPVAPRLAYIAVGEFGAPIFAPWALNVSYPKSYAPYVLPDGTLANGAPGLREAYASLRLVLPQISFYAGTDKLKVFMSELPGQRFLQSAEVNGVKVTVTGEQDGQAIVIHPAGRELLLVGYRADVTIHDASFQWPGLRNVHIEKGYWAENRWVRDGEPTYGLDQARKTLGVDLGSPQAVRISW